MRNVIMTAMVFSMLAAMSAYADGTKADFEKFGQPIVQRFSDCLSEREDEVAKGYKTDENAANELIDGCRQYLDQVKARMLKAPFSMTEEAAANEANTVESEARGVLIKEISQKRKAN